jgi:hypothetical protein
MRDLPVGQAPLHVGLDGMPIPGICCTIARAPKSQFDELIQRHRSFQDPRTKIFRLHFSENR